MNNKFLLAAALALASLAPAQSVILSKAEKTGSNHDKFLYRITPSSNSKYLGEIEVSGAAYNDPEIFSKIYTKAKTIGANAFSLQYDTDIDGSPLPPKPDHYRINLYEAQNFPSENNIVYLFSSGTKPIKVRVDGKKITLKPRSYLKKIITYGGNNYISAGQFLGSQITLHAKEGQPVQYFQINALNIKGDDSGQGGINIKAGDIVGLERSYAEFLASIYLEQNF